jgi:hypothetical protein
LLATAVGAHDPAPVESSPRPALLGRGEADLREEFGEALRSEPIEPRRVPVLVPEKLQSGTATVAPGAAARSVPESVAKDPFADQQRFVRNPQDSDVDRLEYELFRTRVYRVRWRLAERFERPIMTSLVAHLSAELGKPYYDQLIEGKFGSGRATLRRAAWRCETRSLEVRQLNPLVGGPLFLTLSDQEKIKAIVASGGTAAPEPDSIGPWWREPVKISTPLTSRERKALLAAFDVVLARANWAEPEPQASATLD